MKLKELYNNRKIILFYTMITMIYFGIFAKIEYATDTYATFSFSLKEFCNIFSASGRFLTVFSGIIVRTLKLSDSLCYSLSFILAVLSMIFSQYKLYKIIKEDIECKELQIIIPVLIILNIFSIELFLFIEKGIIIFGIFMCICALENIIKLFKTNEKKYYLFSLIFILLANFSYQGVIGIFIAISVIYIIKFSKNIKDFFINNVIVGSAYVLPTLFDYIAIKMLFKNDRINGERILIESIKKISLSTVRMIISTYNILPKFLFLGLIISVLLLIIYKILSQKNLRLVNILKVLYIVLAIIMVSILPQMLQNTNSIWFVPRSTYSYAALFGILVLYLVIYFKPNKNIIRIILFLSVILLLFQFCSFNKIGTDRYKINEMDYEISKKINEYINEYENKTGNHINKIAIYHDSGPQYSYDRIFTTGDTNIKAYSIDWSIVSILKYYCQKDLELINKDDMKQIKFNEKNWMNFDKDQLIFEKDTLHLCIY